MLVTAGLGLAGWGLASGTARAEVGPVPEFQWCPGQDWHPEWGVNWDWGNCHDLRPDVSWPQPYWWWQQPTWWWQQPNWGWRHHDEG
jgi:hypothetical protein